MTDGITRRDFLKSAGGVIAGVTLPGATALAAREATVETATRRTADSAARDIVLDVNGTRRAVTVEPRMTLAEVLRGPLALTGTKIGCGRGYCSACTVWLDGAPICACMLLAVDAGGRKILTIEGLANDAELHPVQSAFIAHDAIQCGFCTPGLVMTSAAFVEKNRNPSTDEIRSAIGGHLCRCGTYPHVVEAVLDAAKAMRG